MQHTSSPSPAHFPTAIDRLIAYWQGQQGGQERANYQLFLIGLTEALGLARPDAAGPNTEANQYVFERAVTFREPDGSTSTGRIDLYRKGAFVLEAKQSRQQGQKKAVPGQADLFVPETEPRGERGATRAWDVLMLNARRQAEDYARALPVGDGWPPFLLICDVGHCIEVFADFSGQGKNYSHFPDRNDEMAETAAVMTALLASAKPLPPPTSPATSRAASRTNAMYGWCSMPSLASGTCRQPMAARASPCGGVGDGASITNALRRPARQMPQPSQGMLGTGNSQL